MSEKEIRDAVKLASKMGNIKQQKLYCFRTKKLTLLGAIVISFMLVKITEKTIEKFIEIKNEEMSYNSYEG